MMVFPAAKKTYVLKLSVLGIAAIAYYFLPGIRSFVEIGMKYLCNRDFEGLRQFILSYGMWAPCTTIALMIVQSMVPFVPGLAITITNAWIFGWQYGALYSWVGALLGATLDFGIARWYGRPVVENFISVKYLDWSDGFFARHGVMAVFITRLTPIVPFKVISYGAGLTTISLCQFLVATGVGQTPAIILYSILGENLVCSIHATAVITTLLVGFGFLIYCYRDVIERYLFSKK